MNNDTRAVIKTLPSTVLRLPRGVSRGLYVVVYAIVLCTVHVVLAACVFVAEVAYCLACKCPRHVSRAMVLSDDG